jgi:membrane protease YdiL (CAAX protease family)
MERLLFVAALTFLMLGLGLATFYSGRLLRRFIPPENVLLTLPDNVARLLLILLCVALGLWLGPGPAGLGWPLGRLSRDALVGIAAAAVLAPVFDWAGNAAVRRWGREVYDNRLLRAIVPINRAEWIGVVLALLPAALLEELLFRSLPLGGLSWVISPWVLMWPLSLLFGLMHASQGQWGVVGTALMGLMLSVLFLWTGSIWSAVVAHWLLNVVEVTLAQRQGLRPLRADRETAP